MIIRFTSTLTPEHENEIAPALLKSMTAILELLPIAYVLRIETTDDKVFSSTSAPALGLGPGGPVTSKAPGAETFES